MKGKAFEIRAYVGEHLKEKKSLNKLKRSDRDMRIMIITRLSSPQRDFFSTKKNSMDIISYPIWKPYFAFILCFILSSLLLLNIPLNKRKVSSSFEEKSFSFRFKEEHTLQKFFLPFAVEKLFLLIHFVEISFQSAKLSTKSLRWKDKTLSSWKGKTFSF